MMTSSPESPNRPELEIPTMIPEVKNFLERTGFKIGKVELQEKLSNPETLIKARRILDRLIVLEKVNGNEEEKAKLRESLLGSLVNSYSTRVRESFQALSVEQLSFQEELDSGDLNFTEQERKLLQEIIDGMQMPGDDPIEQKKSLLTRSVVGIGGQQSAIHVGRIHTYERKLSGIVAPGGTPEGNFIQRLRSRLKEYTQVDPYTEAQYQYENPVKTFDSTRISGTLKALGFMVVAGYTILSGIIDLKSKKPSLATFGGLGLMALMSGKLSGPAKATFLNTFPAQLNELGIKGKDWARVFEEMSSKEQANNIGAFRKELSDIESRGSGNATEKERTMKVAQQKFVDELIPELERGNGDVYEKMLAMQPKVLLGLAEKAQTVEREEDKEMMTQVIEGNTKTIVEDMETRH